MSVARPEHHHQKWAPPLEPCAYRYPVAPCTGNITVMDVGFRRWVDVRDGMGGGATPVSGRWCLCLWIGAGKGHLGAVVVACCHTPTGNSQAEAIRTCRRRMPSSITPLKAVPIHDRAHKSTSCQENGSKMASGDEPTSAVLGSNGCTARIVPWPGTALLLAMKHAPYRRLSK